MATGGNVPKRGAAKPAAPKAAPKAPAKAPVKPAAKPAVRKVAAPATAPAKKAPVRKPAVKNPAAKPAAKPATPRAPRVAKPAPAPVVPPPVPEPEAPAPALLSARELNRLWVEELRAALQHELKELEVQLDSILSTVRQELRAELAEISGRVNESAATTGLDDPSTLARTEVMNKLAQRLMVFRSQKSPSLDDLMELRKRLKKAVGKIS